MILGTFDAVFAGGKLEPSAPLPLSENQRVRITVESDGDSAMEQDLRAFAEVQAFRRQLGAKYGKFSDSALLIREDRDRHE
jgi:hypothetical protein